MLFYICDEIIGTCIYKHIAGPRYHAQVRDLRCLDPYNLVTQKVKNLPAMQGTGFDPWVWKSPWRRAWLPTPTFLPGEFLGQGSLAGYSPWGHKESGRTFTFALQKLCVCCVIFNTDEETGAKITQPMKTRALMRRNCKTHLCSQTQAILPLIIQCGSPS